MSETGGEGEGEGWLTAPKEEAVTHAQAVLSALIRALYVFVIEAIIHGLLHGLERYVTHEAFPKYVYRFIEWGGVISLLLYVGASLWKHCVDTYVDTRLESRESLDRLKTGQKNRNNTQVPNVDESGHNEHNHES